MDRSKFSLEGRRLTALVVAGTALLILLFGLVKLQIVNHAELKAQSENNRIRVTPIIPRRGRVYDREGRIVIDNRPSYTVSIVPVEINERTLLSASQLLHLDTISIRKRYRKNTVSRYQPAPVKRDVSFDLVAILEEQNSAFPGVAYQMERVREYLPSLMGESFTGYVGEVSEGELRKLAGSVVRSGSIIGKKGLEKYYDSLLRGTEGTEYTEVTASGQIIGRYQDRPSIPARPGSDLYLSIDNDLQTACAQALDTFCCGAIVAMDPRNGEILAMISYPGYDPNIFSSVIPESLWNAISSDSTHPLLNRPLNGLYPPGSITKLVTLGAGLEEGLVNKNTTFKTCLGGYQFGNRFFRCWKAVGHGSLSSVHAVAQSCDTYFYQLGLKLGIDGLSRYYRLCGFGRPTGIDLPGESPGLNPNTDYYNQRYGKGEWSRGLVLNNSIGQGEVLVNIIQVAQLFAGLVNQGVVYHPHLLKGFAHPGEPRTEIQPQIAFRLPFSGKTLDILLESLRQVVESKEGTARKLRNKLYTLGGKTGTSQNPHGENHSWFVAVAPLEAPEIVVVAIVENSGDGSAVAAPIVRQILNKYFEKKLGSEEVAATVPAEK